MKKIIFIIASLAAVVLLSSFVISRNVTSNTAKNPETVSTNDGWEYYKPVTIYYKDGDIRFSDVYIWKKTVCGDPDYMISWSNSELRGEAPISKNYYYGKEQDWTTEYKYVTTIVYNNRRNAYFNTYLQGWD